MRHDFAALSHIQLAPQSTFEHPPELPELVHLNSPAIDVMTDFRYVRPVTVDAAEPIDEALERMRSAGVRLLLVTDEQHHIIGLVTAKDIQGEKPIKLVEEARIPRSEIRVETIMTPQSAIIGLNMVSVRNAMVGHVLETLRQLERQHILVLEVDETSKTQKVRGLFSSSQIARQLGKDVIPEVARAHSLAEMQHELG